jgi:hypothetical protein
LSHRKPLKSLRTVRNVDLNLAQLCSEYALVDIPVERRM